MRLKQVVISGYRSIRKPTTLFVEPDVTVILGPNDHGKTNCLSALLHLNEDTPFLGDRDLDWDSAANSDALPAVVASFKLAPNEIEELLAAELPILEKHNQLVEEQRAAQAAALADSLQPLAAEPQQRYDMLTAADFIDDVVVRREGVKGKLVVESPAALFDETQKMLEQMVPRFELIDPVAKLSDSVTAEQLSEGQNEFMRGIFYYAGLDPDNSDSLFEQDDRTSRQLARASEQLDKTLRKTWSQGRSLRFELRHDSKTKKIELLISDPSVESRFVRASRRSSGFTHYFALKTILHARQKDHPANSYFLLFDEPGIYLHPTGQYELLQVIETLARESQVAYVTHSLFMINKTFPTRHRLLMKGEDGTTLDGKPYVGRWQAVLGSLGMALTGTILFSNYVVLTEGDSDPILLNAMLQKGVRAGKTQIDLNAVTFISTGESKHADVLIRLLLETNPRPVLGVITDGDKGGKERLVYLNTLIKDHSIETRPLPKDTSIEDHLPNLREVYVLAVADYVIKLLSLRGEARVNEEELRNQFMEHFDKHFDRGRVTTRVTEWAALAAGELAKVTGKPSKIGIAREYANRLMALPEGQLRWDDRARSMVDWLTKTVGVPEMSIAPRAILQGDGP